MVSLQALIWLQFAAFLCHDAEEVLTVEPWFRRHGDAVRQLPQARLIDGRRPVAAQFAVAAAVVGSAVLSASWVGARTFAESGQLHWLFVGVLVVLLLDGVKHILLAVRQRLYSPGVVTAALVELPYALYAFYRFFSAGVLTWKGTLLPGLIGLAAIFPLLGLGFALGRWLVPVRRAA